MLLQKQLPLSTAIFAITAFHLKGLVKLFSVAQTTSCKK